MAITVNKHGYDSSKGILLHPDHFVGQAHLADTVEDKAVDRGNTKVIPAGTIYPSNDENALGVVLNDKDITYGTGNVTVVVHGFIKSAALPEQPTEEAKQAMKLVFFA